MVVTFNDYWKVILRGNMGVVVVMPPPFQLWRLLYGVYALLFFCLCESKLCFVILVNYHVKIIAGYFLILSFAISDVLC